MCSAPFVVLLIEELCSIYTFKSFKNCYCIKELYKTLCGTRGSCSKSDKLTQVMSFESVSHVMSLESVSVGVKGNEEKLECGTSVTVPHLCLLLAA